MSSSADVVVVVVVVVVAVVAAAALEIVAAVVGPGCLSIEGVDCGSVGFVAVVVVASLTNRSFQGNRPGRYHPRPSSDYTCI